VVTIIVGVADTAQLVRFYDAAYSRDPSQALLYARWRALGAVGKADHVLALCKRARLAPESVLEVGCGDGALLCELHRRGFGGHLEGVEIAQSAVDIAEQRPEIDAVHRYDGHTLPVYDDAYELGILSHVLEHVLEPTELLAEVGRACRAVLVEVPLEDNLSARRAHKREHALQVGHLQHLNRHTVREIVARAGLRVACELEDPLPLRAQRFFAASRTTHATATLKWAVRSGVHGLAPAAARKLFSVHYACLCVPEP
jgi:SAM-dependent methyltransferase